jgi:hypothetical protein
MLPYEEVFICENCTLGLFYDCSRLVSTLVNLMEHTLKFFGVFNPLGVKVFHLSVIENSHLFIEPIFDLMKCSMVSV